MVDALRRGGPLPAATVWARELLHAARVQRLCATYAPRGPAVFVVITDPQSVAVVVPEGAAVFRFAADVAAPLPVVCLATVAATSAQCTVVLTDAFVIGGVAVSHCDAVDRLSYVCFEVLEKVEVAGVLLTFRAVGRVSAARMVQLDEKLLRMLAIQSDGVALIAHSWPAGMSYFLPTRPTVRLLVLFNTDHDVVLYARADDGDGFWPMFVRRVQSSADIKVIDTNVVRFELAVIDGTVKLKMLGLELPETTDFASYVNEILNYLTRSTAKGDLEEIERTIRESDALTRKL
jgi:hypothetical protein